ncbi:MAG: DUF2849 domain-containing protein [Alphaproteobacteria bacterium]|nr:DUF2849 domain-containing protein [Alphaproteobacteria bacterium]
MAAPKLPQVLTANRLREGDVVYWNGSGWVADLQSARIYADKDDAAPALSAADDSVKARAVVNPYLFPVKADVRPIAPTEEREIIRAAGPSVRTDLGKQAKESFDVSI